MSSDTDMPLGGLLGRPLQQKGSLLPQSLREEVGTGSQGLLRPQFFQEWSSGERAQPTTMPTFLPPFPGEEQRPGPGNVERKGGMEGRVGIWRAGIGEGLGVCGQDFWKDWASQGASEPAWLGPLQGRASGDCKRRIRS